MKTRDWRALIPGHAARSSNASSSPAFFGAFVEREPWRERGYPEEWPSSEGLPLGSDARIAAVVHVFYPDLVDQVLDHLEAIPALFDLILTDATGRGVAVDASRLSCLRYCLTLAVENRGRDLWPLAQVVNAGYIDRYDLVVKVHTKRSDWRDAHGKLSGTGRGWRGELLSSLLGGRQNVEGILGAFAASPDLGIVTADGSVLGPAFWGRDEPVAATLLERVDVKLRPDGLVFAAGSMYWSRASILQGLRGLYLTAADFEDERGQLDGTTAHALERVIGLLAQRDGFRIAERSRLAREQGSGSFGHDG
jgi:lipopolysaccharide biosynthesis protein